MSSLEKLIEEYEPNIREVVENSELLHYVTIKTEYGNDLEVSLEEIDYWNDYFEFEDFLREFRIQKYRNGAV